MKIPRKIWLKKIGGYADIYNVGYIVPLPNHYIPDMPQGHGPV